MKITISGWSASEASPRTAEVSGPGWKTAAGLVHPHALDPGRGGWDGDTGRDGQRRARWACRVGHRVLGSDLPQRLRADPAVQWSGGGVLVPASGLPVPVAGAVRQDRAAVPRGGGVVCPSKRHPVGEVRQGRPQAGGDAPTPGAAGRDRSFRGGGDRGGAGVPAGLDRLPAPHTHRGAPVQFHQGRPAGELLLPAPCGTPTSARRSSRSAPTSPTRSRSGSTVTSGPNAKPPRPGWPSRSCPTGLGPAPTLPCSRRSATGSGQPPSTSSCSAGLLVCRCRWARRIGMAATGGSARCGRSRSPAPWCSTRHATPAGSSRR
jgi:hypothetical protein